MLECEWRPDSQVYSSADWVRHQTTTDRHITSPLTNASSWKPSRNAAAFRSMYAFGSQFKVDAEGGVSGGSGGCMIMGFRCIGGRERVKKGAAAAYNIEYNILKDLVCGRKLGSQLVFMFIILRFCRTMTQTIRPL